mgnify:CR=1 FL=1
MSFFYHYLFHPIQSMQGRKEWPAQWAVVAILVSAFIALYRTGSSSLGLWFFYAVFVTLLLIISSLMIDFIAQLFSLAPNSKQLFYALSITHIPYIVGLPLSSLYFMFPNTVLGALAAIGYALLFVFVIYLQIKAVQCLYDITVVQAFFLFASPLILLLFLALLLPLSFLMFSVLV